MRNGTSSSQLHKNALGIAFVHMQVFVSHVYTGIGVIYIALVQSVFPNRFTIAKIHVKSVFVLLC